MDGVKQSELERARRNTKNRKKRKREQKLLGRKSKQVPKSNNGGTTTIEDLPAADEVDVRECSSPQEKNGCDDETPAPGTSKVTQNQTLRNPEAERYHRHAVWFHSKLRNAETKNVPILDNSAVEVAQEIGRGSFGKCFLASYGGRKVVVKKELKRGHSLETEARLLNKVRHPNMLELIGVLRTKGESCSLVTQYYSVEGKHSTLSNFPDGKQIDWLDVFRGLFQGLKYLHTKANVLHNDIKGNNVVLQGVWEAEFLPF